MTISSYRVTGPATIIGVDGEPVTDGGTVELDDEVTNVDALLEAEVIAPAKAKPGKPSDSGDSKGD